MSQRLLSAAYCTLAILLMGSAGCGPSIPPPSPEEIKERDYWGSLVAPDVRQNVIEHAQRHTSWSEKRQVQWEIERFHSLATQSQHKERESTTRESLPPLPY